MEVRECVFTQLNEMVEFAQHGGRVASSLVTVVVSSGAIFQCGQYKKKKGMEIEAESTKTRETGFAAICWLAGSRNKAQRRH